MPSPWKVSPSPSLSACTSFLNERSILRPWPDSWDPNYIARLPLHAGGQPQSKDRECDQNHQANQVGNDKRNHALEDGRETHVFHHAFYHEHVHSDRRVDEAELDGHDDDHAEPNRIKAEVRDHGE